MLKRLLANRKPTIAVIEKETACHCQNVDTKLGISWGAPAKNPISMIMPKGRGIATIVAGAKDGVKTKVNTVV